MILLKNFNIIHLILSWSVGEKYDTYMKYIRWYGLMKDLVKFKYKLII